MTLEDLMALAEAYRQAAGISLTTLSRMALGNNRTLCRVSQGHGCHSSTVEQAAYWFNTNWPVDLPWPIDTPRRNPAPAESRPGEGEAHAGGLPCLRSPGRDCAL